MATNTPHPMHRHDMRIALWVVALLIACAVLAYAGYTFYYGSDYNNISASETNITPNPNM